LPVKEWFDAAFSVALFDFTSLDVLDLFAATASVAANDLLELVVKLFVLVSLLLLE
jgi:hypothetical protein